MLVNLLVACIVLLLGWFIPLAVPPRPRRYKKMAFRIDRTDRYVELDLPEDYIYSQYCPKCSHTAWWPYSESIQLFPTSTMNYYVELPLLADEDKRRFSQWILDYALNHNNVCLHTFVRDTLPMPKELKSMILDYYWEGIPSTTWRLVCLACYMYLDPRHE
jgi:hypothetical protein